MSEVIYTLKKPFEYSSKGEMRTAEFITLIAPTFKQLDRATPIKQAFTSAISEITESIVADRDDTDDITADGNDTMTGGNVMQVMYRWSGDMTKVLLHAESLFKSGSALVDGDSRLTTPLMEKMQLVDFEGLVGDYIANFIAPSLTDGQ